MVHNGAMADAIPSRPAPPPLDDSCALFLDVDGTLVDFDTDPDAVRLRPQLRGAIGTISDRLGGAVALVGAPALEDHDGLARACRAQHLE